MLNAFCLVAPLVRFNAFAIFAAGVFFRASVLRVLTLSAVHSRRFVAFLVIKNFPVLLMKSGFVADSSYK